MEFKDVFTDLRKNFVKGKPRGTDTAERLLFYLSFFEGFSNDETAKIMNKTRRQIESLLYNAKKALKNELERSGFEYEN